MLWMVAAAATVSIPVFSFSRRIWWLAGRAAILRHPLLLLPLADQGQMDGQTSPTHEMRAADVFPPSETFPIIENEGATRVSVD